MLGTDEQRRLMEAVAAAAGAEGCLAAPVGSLYFLLTAQAKTYTKDVDAVIHSGDLEPVDLDILKRIARRLGPYEITIDEAVVQIRTRKTADLPDVELIRGRSRAKGGFFPRALLAEAAKASKRQGNLLVYPLEYVLILKADAAIDRDERALRDTKRREEHRRRAEQFRADVFSEVNRALLSSGLNRKFLASGVAHLKRKRANAVVNLLKAAGAPLP